MSPTLSPRRSNREAPPETCATSDSSRAQPSWSTTQWRRETARQLEASNHRNIGQVTNSTFDSFRIFRGTIFIGLALCLSAFASAATLRGEVVGLADGDTVTVLDNTSKTLYRVRLAGIDAPEKRQPFGDRSRQNLAAIVFRKQVVVDWHKTDRYGRIVGTVTTGQVDAGLEQIRAGMAWHYKQYAREQVAEDRSAYSAAEDAAREARAGLWSQRDPVPPWDFRKAANSSPQPTSP